jgi:hypothetical protein
MIPVDCCDEHDERLSMARYLVRCALTEALRQRGRSEVAFTVMGIARMIAIDLLVERDMTRASARKLVDECTALLEGMTDVMAKEAGLAG